MSGGKSWAYIGTLTSLGKSKGIYVFDIEDGRLGALVQEVACPNPTFLAACRETRSLYAASHCSSVDGNSGGAIHSFSVDVETGRLSAINTQYGVSPHPAYISVDRRERWLLAGSTMGGALSVFPLLENGGVGECIQAVQHEGKMMDPWPELLTRVVPTSGAPMVHCVLANPANDSVAVADLGLNQVYLYPFDDNLGKLNVERKTVFSIDREVGPRHCAWHPAGHTLYVVNERNSTVSVFRVNRSTNSLRLQQEKSCLPEGCLVSNKPAEIRLHASGRFLYVSNRGHNSIAAFGIDPDDFSLTMATFTTEDIDEPRGMSLLPDSTSLFVANQNSDSVVSFTIDEESGRLKKLPHSALVPSPTCISFFYSPS